jgi:transcriptional regulator with XRE-family HTH domain
MSNGGYLKLIGSYSFIDKDPVVDRFQAIRAKEKISNKELAILAKLTPSTVYNLFEGKTVKPVHLTLAKLAAAMNYRYDLVRDGPPDYEKNLPKAWEAYRAHQADLKSKKKRRPRKKKTNGKT